MSSVESIFQISQLLANSSPEVELKVQIQSRFMARPSLIGQVDNVSEVTRDDSFRSVQLTNLTTTGIG